VFELLAIDDDLRALILARDDGAVLRTRALAKGMKTMFQDSLAKALPCRTGNVAIISGH
jgi:type II secretory ATPase GspE/PulE/Tfp pilus assembly ATPase PilB-like protein